MVVTSNNGTNWPAGEYPGIIHLSGVTYGDDKFMAVGTYAGKSMTSSDVVVWQSYYGIIPNRYGVAYGNGTFVAVGVMMPE
ncbi:hypothetical protein MHH56_04940 [Paenibacillus sp. FSL K6-3182]|uniref:hypothetical protein n=1 Tax=Paenibacillus sp. FSL K6-3182 TaxID=2921495 RepID=UPI0030CB2A5A